MVTQLDSRFTTERPSYSRGHFSLQLPDGTYSGNFDSRTMPDFFGYFIREMAQLKRGKYWFSADARAIRDSRREIVDILDDVMRKYRVQWVDGRAVMGSDRDDHKFSFYVGSCDGWKAISDRALGVTSELARLLSEFIHADVSINLVMLNPEKKIRRKSDNCRI